MKEKTLNDYIFKTIGVQSDVDFLLNTEDNRTVVAKITDDLKCYYKVNGKWERLCDIADFMASYFDKTIKINSHIEKSKKAFATELLVNKLKKQQKDLLYKQLQEYADMVNKEKMKFNNSENHYYILTYMPERGLISAATNSCFIGGIYFIEEEDAKTALSIFGDDLEKLFK